MVDMLRGFFRRGNEALGSDTLTIWLTAICGFMALGTILGIFPVPIYMAIVLIAIVTFNCFQLGLIPMPKWANKVSPYLDTRRIDTEVLKAIRAAGDSGITAMEIKATVLTNTNGSEYPLNLSVDTLFASLKRLYNARPRRKIEEVRKESEAWKYRAI